MAMRIVSVKFDPVTELTTYILQNTESYSLPGFSINYVLIFVFSWNSTSSCNRNEI